MQLSDEFKVFRKAIESELFKNILPFHINHLVDKERGGFFGAISNDLVVSRDADKGVIQCSRILWTYARAYRQFRLEEHLQVARHAYTYLIERFWDEQYGGFYWVLDACGKPLDTGKLIYAQVFAIYGLAEFYLTSGDAHSLETAKKLFHLIEEHAILNESGGYADACERDCQIDHTRNVDSIDFTAAFSMNTHLHLLEAYTNLLLAWPDDFLRTQLHKLIVLTIEHIYDTRNCHLLLHFDADWQPLNSIISYAHDIEASWLLWEAAETLGDEAILERVRPVTLKLAETVLHESFDPQAGGIFDERRTDGVFVDSKGWWAQAEAMVGFFNAYQLSGDEAYLNAVLKTWQFIREHISDHQYGEWYWGVNSQGVVLNEEKTGMWKTPYHNGRACMELMQRI
ncbi:MAG: AGE family epimerase/isomerase [Anaerolineaceae bacterium]|nr:AGE family epimerase/isomerase [Anaerolineaceae bacterium]